jgi:hypothetical protein
MSILAINCHDYRIIYLLIIIIAPVIPAFLLFKFLPKSSANASGPFKGLQIKLGGAFAGYFPVFLLLILKIYPDLKCAPDCPPCPERAGKFEINGIATDSTGLGIDNRTISAYHIRRRTVIDSANETTGASGGYGFLFENVKDDDIITVKWEDPKGKIYKERYSPKGATSKITFKRTRNEN